MHGARRSCRDDAICCWETRKHFIGVVVAVFPMCPHRLGGVTFGFVSCPYSFRLSCVVAHKCMPQSMVAGSSAFHRCGFVNLTALPMEDGQGTSNAAAHSVHVVSDVRFCRAGTCGFIPYVC